MAQSTQRSVASQPTQASQSLPDGYELEDSGHESSSLPAGYTVEGQQAQVQSKPGAMTPPPVGASSMGGESDGFWHWFFGSFTGDPKYQNKGLLHAGNVERAFDALSEYGKRKAREREDYRSSREYYDKVIAHYNDQIAQVNARKDISEADKAWHRKLIEEEKNNRLGSNGAVIEQFAPQALQTASDIGKSMLTPKNAAVAGVAAAVPESRPFIGAYYAATGLYNALKPRNDDPQDPDYETEADYIQRVLFSSSQVAGSIALTKAPRRTAAQERQYRLNKATFAGGGGNTQFDAALEDIDQTLRQTKAKVKSVSDVQDLVQATERRLNQHFEQALFPLRGQKILPSQVADVLEAKANQPNLQMTPEGRVEANMYRRAAASYRQEWTLEKLDLERRRLFDSRIAKKTSVQQSASRRQNISTDIDQTIEDNIRDLEYSELNRRYPNQNFGNLKFRQSQLIELKDMLEKRVEQLRNAQAKEKGAPVLMGERATGSMTKHGVFGRVSAKIPGAGPETAANRAAGKAFKTPGPGTELPTLQTAPRGGMTPPPLNPQSPQNASPQNPPASPNVPPRPAAPVAPVAVLGRGAMGLGGRTTRSISINGQSAGSLIYTVDGDTLTIDHFGGPQSNYNSLKNSLGREGMAQLRDQLLKAHPEVKHIQGIRIGGARGEEARSVRVPVKRMQRAKGKMTPPPAAKEPADEEDF